MANWSDMGHAMRRRSGAPSNHKEAAGKSMSRNIMTPEEVLASAAHSASPRQYVGSATSGFNNVSGTPEKGSLVAKKNTQASDPTSGGKSNRSNIPAGDATQSERMGARYRVGVKYPSHHSAESAPTMASARSVRSVSGRQAPNFGDGMQSSSI